jgi:hypothetical protein
VFRGRPTGPAAAAAARLPRSGEAVALLAAGARARASGRARGSGSRR